MKTKKAKTEKYPKYWFFKDFDGTPSKFTTCDCVKQDGPAEFSMVNSIYDSIETPKRTYETWIEVPKHEAVLILGYLP